MESFKNKCVLLPFQLCPLASGILLAQCPVPWGTAGHMAGAVRRREEGGGFCPCQFSHHELGKLGLCRHLPLEPPNPPGLVPASPGAGETGALWALHQPSTFRSGAGTQQLWLLPTSCCPDAPSPLRATEAACAPSPPALEFPSPSRVIPEAETGAGTLCLSSVFWARRGCKGLQPAPGGQGRSDVILTPAAGEGEGARSQWAGVCGGMRVCFRPLLSTKNL